MSNDDTFSDSYKYAWYKGEDNELTLEQFLTKYKPSMVQDDGTKPWIWIRGTGSLDSHENPLLQGLEELRAIEEGSAVLKEATDQVERIKNDAKIPIRSNKKTGVKGKKEVREQVQAEAAEKLKNISLKRGYTHGKWLIFAPPDKVDVIWTSIANSLVNGPLSTTSARLAKVSTCRRDGAENVQRLICIYLPDVYDKDSVLQVMKVLLRNHGLNLSGVKPDLYTAIGIDSKHPSGIPSTIWKRNVLLSEAESKALKDAYFAELSQHKKSTTTGGSGSAAKADKTDTAKGDVKPVSANDGKAEAKPKPKPTKKAAQRNIYGTDSEDEGPGSSKSHNESDEKTKRVRDDDSATEPDEDEEPGKKQKLS